MTEGSPVAGEGVAFLNILAARDLRVPRLCGVPKVSHGPVEARLAINGNGMMVPIKYVLWSNGTFDIELMNNGHKLILDKVLFRV